MFPEQSRRAAPRFGSPRSFAGLLAAALLAQGVLTSTAAFAQPTDENKAAARALATQGADALTKGRYAEALDFVTRAEAILHAPTHLLLIARAQSGTGKLVAAQETYLKLTREELPASAPAAFRNAQATGKEELAVIEPRIASLRLVAEGAAQKKATIKIDEVVVPTALLGVYQPIDPGPHTISVFPVGGTPTKTSIELRDGEKKELKLVVPDALAPGVPGSAADDPDAARRTAAHDQGGGGFFTPLRGVGIGLGVLGLVLVGSGGALTAKGFSAQSSANAAATKLGCTSNGTMCPMSAATALATEVTPDDDLAAKDKNIGVGLIVGGVVSLGAGVALIIVGKPSSASRAALGPSVTPYFTGTGGGLRGRF